MRPERDLTRIAAVLLAVDVELERGCPAGRQDGGGRPGARLARPGRTAGRGRGRYPRSGSRRSGRGRNRLLRGAGRERDEQDADRGGEQATARLHAFIPFSAVAVPPGWETTRR